MLYGDLPTSEVTRSDSSDKLRGVTIRIQNPAKLAVLGLPSNEQLIERLGKQRSVRKSLGRRKSVTESVPDTKADLTLFKAIRLDDGPEFDEFEASSAVNKLTSVEVTECEKAGDQFIITLKTPFGENKHTVAVPMQKDLQQYRRSVVSSIDLPHGNEELRFRIGPPCTLYDSVVQGIEGYNSSYKPADVPPNHKSAVVVELVSAMDDQELTIDPLS